MEIIEDIDHWYDFLFFSFCFIDHKPSHSRISAVPTFSGLRRFPDGCNYQQWTGDDSKALMKVRALVLSYQIGYTDHISKVFLAAIAGYIPSMMVHSITAFMDACYITR